MNEISVRNVVADDAKKLLELYAPYVRDTAITFEYDIPSENEFRKRIENIMKDYPYLCAEKDGEILGYAYASSFKERAAYKWSVEISIYVKKASQGLGLGRLLYAALEEELKKRGIVNMYACIAVPTECDDEYLTHNSENFHEHLGFKKVGTFKNCAKKFNRWYSMIWMEKIIGIA